MLRCEAPGCIRKQLITRLSSAGCFLFSQLSLLLPFKACLICSNLSLSGWFCQEAKFLRSPLKIPEILFLQNITEQNRAQPFPAAPHSKGIICSYSFLFAEFLELICHELNFCSYDNLDRVLARTDNACDTG